MHLANCRDRIRRRHLTTIASGLASAALVVAAAALGGMTGAACAVAVIAMATAALALFRLHQLALRYAELLAMIGGYAPTVARGARTDLTAAPTIAASETDDARPAPAGDRPADVDATGPTTNGAEQSFGTPVASVASATQTDAVAPTKMETDRDSAMNDEVAALDGDAPVLAERPNADLRAPATIGTRPDFGLPALSGEIVTPADLAGRATVLVFWRPGCDHCDRLTPELAAWESLQSRGGPRLVVLAATDAPTAYRAHLPGTVLLDPGFSVGRAVAAPGTPAALVLDRDGQPLGGIAAGTMAVTGLLLATMRHFASDEIDEPLADDAVAALFDASAEASAVPATPCPGAVMHRLEALAPAATEVTEDWVDGAIRRTG